ncbi:S-layer homology domain-containing protein [Saccharibacillus sacchari]|uniref:S-layer homology domain-containing protein n=1 Tax=Saccharibacillus sacchari TaxID=456493 RepID=A0ACC6PJP0_9BACL
MNMISAKKKKWPALLAAAVLMTSVFPAPIPASATPANDNIVISQVYGGGGNSGAPFKNDFIELYNPTSTAIDVTGWKIRYASATASSFPNEGENTAVLQGSIGANGYYLIEASAGTGNAATLPTADLSALSIKMAGPNGKVDLIDGSGNEVDLVGYGAANKYEGTAPTEVLSNTTASVRGSVNGLALSNRGLDTDSNRSDFSVASPDPRNSFYDSLRVQSVDATPASGAVIAGTQVSLSSPTVGTSVYAAVYGSGGSETYEPYTSPITITGPTEIRTYAEAEGMTRSEETTYTYSLIEPSAIADVRLLPKGGNALTEGIVTFINSAETYIQDQTGGIVLYGYSNGNVKVGDRVRVGGVMEIYNNLQELKPVDGLPYEVIQENAGVPDPKLLTAIELSPAQGEAHEAELVELTDIEITAKNPTGNAYTATQNGQTFTLFSNSSKLSVGKTFERVTGVVKQYQNEYQLIPLGDGALVEELFSVTANPQSGKIMIGGEVILSSPAAGAEIRYTLDGSEPTLSSSLYQHAFKVEQDTTVKAIAVRNGEQSRVYTFSYETVQQPRIHDIQGRSHTSDYDGQKVEDIEGVVTQYGYTFSSGNYRGFFLQDNKPDNDPATSEGIFVYSTKEDLKPAVGDLVRVSGTVNEYNEGSSTNLTSTQITLSSVNKVEGAVKGVDYEVPQPIVLGKQGRMIPSSVIDDDNMAEFDPEYDAIDFYESLEGMRVTLPSPTILSPYWISAGTYNIAARVENDRNGVVSPAGGLVLKEYLNYNPQRLIIAYGNPGQEVGTGDTFDGDVTGVIGYNNANFKVIPAKNGLPSITASTRGQETTDLVPAEDKLMIASYNIENFYPGTGDAKIKKLGESIATNMKRPDIIGVVEMQDADGPANNGSVEADASALIQAIAQAGGPTYLYTDVAPANNEDGGQPGGNIRVGFLYNPDRVKLSDSVKGAKGDAKTAAGYDSASGKLNHNPARIDPTNTAFKESRKPLAAQFEFKGEQVIVIANHFNSKGGDNSPFGNVQPPILSSEVQRHEIAKTVNTFVKTVLAANPKANIVALGDLNDFQFTPTADLLRGNELVNLIDTLPISEQYTYTYDGNSQVLDHILASKNIAASAKVDVVHLNADYPESRGRVSDHDPVIAQFDLKAVVPAPNPNPNPGTDPGTTPTPTPAPTPTTGGNATNPGNGQTGTPTPGTSPNAASTTTITAADLTAKLSELANGSNEASFPVSSNSAGAEVVLPGAELMRQAAANTNAVLSFASDQGSYSLPLKLLNEANLAGQFTVDFVIKVSMVTLSGDTAAEAKRAASQSGLALVAPILEFRVTAEAQGKTIELNNFGNTYVKRTIALPDGPNTQNLTGVLYDSTTGTFSFVPSVFTTEGGKVTASLMRNGNSYYTVVESLKTFNDINGHWAQAYIEELASRLIVDGTGNGAFTAARNVTRAEFAAIATRALGLAANAGSASAFSDIDQNAWYAEAVGTAVGAGLMNGYPNGTFNPNAPITRQEMAVVLSKATEFAGATLISNASVLGRFNDASDIPAWARESLTKLASSGILQGNAHGRIAPAQAATRAETAVMLEKLLQHLRFID